MNGTSIDNTIESKNRGGYGARAVRANCTRSLARCLNDLNDVAVCCTA